MPQRILFCGTPEFAVPSLEALFKQKVITHVLSQPDRPAGRGHQLQASPVKKKALELGLPVSTPEDINDSKNIDFLKTLQLDAVVVVAYGQLLKQKFLDLCPQKCVNVHGSCLPRWRGAAPIQRALMAGDTESGVSLQVIVRKLDAGPVIGERRLSLSLETTALQLHDQLQILGAELLQKDLFEYLEGRKTPVVQDESLVTYAEKIQKSEAAINWLQSATQIHNQVRGLAMGPQAFSQFRGQIFKIHQTKVVVPTDSSPTPGSVIAVGKDHWVVACGEGALQILAVQPPSKRKMSADEFLRGTPLTVGDRFDS